MADIKTETRPEADRAKPQASASVKPVGGIGNQSPDKLGEEKTTWGIVAGFAIDDKRLMIKLNSGAISRQLIAIGCDEAIFKSAVSLTMMAYNNKERLTVRYLDFDPLYDRAGYEVMRGLEVALGEDALDFKSWPFKYTGELSGGKD